MSGVHGGTLTRIRPTPILGFDSIWTNHKSTTNTKATGLSGLFCLGTFSNHWRLFWKSSKKHSGGGGLWLRLSYEVQVAEIQGVFWSRSEFGQRYGCCRRGFMQPAVDTFWHQSLPFQLGPLTITNYYQHTCGCFRLRVHWMPLSMSAAIFRCWAEVESGDFRRDPVELDGVSLRNVVPERTGWGWKCSVHVGGEGVELRQHLPGGDYLCNTRQGSWAAKAASSSWRRDLFGSSQVKMVLPMVSMKLKRAQLWLTQSSWKCCWRFFQSHHLSWACTPRKRSNTHPLYIPQTSSPCHSLLPLRCKNIKRLITLPLVGGFQRVILPCRCHTYLENQSAHLHILYNQIWDRVTQWSLWIFWGQSLGTWSQVTTRGGGRKAAERGRSWRADHRGNLALSVDYSTLKMQHPRAIESIFFTLSH